MLLSFEGLDGSGKTTQARLLEARLREEGYQTLLVREPGGTALGEQVRGLLLDPSLHIAPMAELMLFSSARAQLVAEKVRPALEAGTVVLCDRFFDSTLAYQGGGRGVAPLAWLRDFCLHVTAGLLPSRTYLVRVTPETAFQRRRPHGGRRRGLPRPHCRRLRCPCRCRAGAVLRARRSRVTGGAARRALG